MHIMQSRRDFLAGLSLVGTAGLLGARGSLADEGPPETTTIRLARSATHAPKAFARRKVHRPRAIGRRRSERSSVQRTVSARARPGARTTRFG